MYIFWNGFPGKCVCYRVADNTFWTTGSLLPVMAIKPGLRLIRGVMYSSTQLFPQCICSNCKMYLFKLQNVFVQIAKCICLDCKVYLSLYTSCMLARIWKSRRIACIAIAASADCGLRQSPLAGVPSTTTLLASIKPWPESSLDFAKTSATTTTTAVTKTTITKTTISTW